jgi:hypothetical protein
MFRTNSIVSFIRLLLCLVGLTDIPTIGGSEQSTPPQDIVAIFGFPSLPLELISITGAG